MEVTDILNFITGIPWWGWFIIVIISLIFFGDKKQWEYEVKFPMKEGIGRGEIELECFNKKGASIEIKLQLEPGYNNKEITIYLSRHLIFTIPADKNIGNHLRLDEKIELEEPREGEELTVKINGHLVFNGQLVLD